MKVKSQTPWRRRKKLRLVEKRISQLNRRLVSAVRLHLDLIEEGIKKGWK